MSDPFGPALGVASSKRRRVMADVAVKPSENTPNGRTNEPNANVWTSAPGPAPIVTRTDAGLVYVPGGPLSGAPACSSPAAKLSWYGWPTTVVRSCHAHAP